MNPRFPVYIISKNRHIRRPTANMLEGMGVPYYVVVEAPEYEKYKEVCKGEVLILPQKYLDEYDTFWPRDTDNRTGPGPARNYCWDHSIKNGFTWHWVLDDNIESLERFNYNMKVKCVSGTPMYIMEDFVLRYKNIAQAGPAYSIFCPASESRKSLIFNTRIYSYNLIRNDIPYRWRGRYNEDTDLSLRALKDGWCTVEFRVFLQGKRATQSMQGGNTAEFYKDEGTYNKSLMLKEMHPDVTTLTKKFNRWHHHVDYRPFKKNILQLKDGLIIENKVNNYGMKLYSKNVVDNSQ
jgi:hypothetical protein